MRLGVLWAMLLLLGCRQDEKEASPAYTKTFEQGEVEMRVELDRQQLTTTEHAELKLVVLVPEGLEVAFPKIEDDMLGDFIVASYRTPLPELVGKRVAHRKSFVLEPLVAVKAKIPELEVTFGKKGAEEKGKIESREITLDVTSLTKDDKSKLKPEVGPLPLPKPKYYFVYWFIVGLLLLLLVGLAVVRLLGKRSPATAAASEIIRDPAEIAYEELERLRGEKLIERGEVKLFYLRVSGILRHYIEDRFRLCAPERTTEEFLAELRGSGVLNQSQKDLLKEFLQHCDMVKFAELKPEEGEIDRTYDTCRSFIEETREVKDV